MRTKLLTAMTAALLLTGCSNSAPKPTAGLFHDYLNAYQLRAPGLNYQDNGAALKQADAALFDQLSQYLIKAPLTPQSIGDAARFNPAILDWVQQQAETGNTAAQLHLGGLYWLQQDWKHAEQWLLKVANEPFARYLLALLYGDERNPDYQPEEGQRWLQRSADQGYQDARRLLAWRYVKGEQVPQNWQRARRLYQALAAEGDNLSAAQLGLMQMFGIGGERNSAAAVAELKKSAELPVVAYSLALAHRYGIGTAVNTDQAQQYLDQANNAGFTLAANLQGQWLATGDTDERDDADEWFRRAVTEQSVMPQFNLGLSYWRGVDVRQDFEEARRWLTPVQDSSLAARSLLAFLATVDRPFGDREAIELAEQGLEQGDAWSFYLTGVLLARGQNVTVDYTESYAHLNVASALGYRPATEVRDTVLSQLSHAQRSKGQVLSQQMFNRLQATQMTADAGAE